jgi:hypothetical protein
MDEDAMQGREGTETQFGVGTRVPGQEVGERTNRAGRLPRTKLRQKCVTTSYLVSCLGRNKLLYSFRERHDCDGNKRESGEQTGLQRDGPSSGTSLSSAGAHLEVKRVT